MTYCYEFHWVADDKAKALPALQPRRLKPPSPEENWRFDGMFDHKPNETLLRCESRRELGAKGYFIRASSEEEARQKLEHLPEPETFFIA